MDINHTVCASGAVDINLLAAAVQELNIARRNVSSYPLGHPASVKSCGRVADMFARILADRDELTIGVSKETLICGSVSLDRLTPTARSVARSLSYHGIALITVRRGLSAQEIESLSTILMWKRPEVADAGGIEKVIAEAGIDHLEVQLIRYESFLASDDCGENSERGSGSASLWESFVLNLMGNISDSGDDAEGQMAAEALARILNSRSDEVSDLIAESLESVLWELHGADTLSTIDRESLGKIGALLGKLNPDLRKRLLESVFRMLPDHEDAALEILSNLPGEVIPEAFELVLEHRDEVSPLIREVIAKLAGAPVPVEVPEVVSAPGFDGSPYVQDDELREIFREEAVEEYVPKGYLETLRSLVTSPAIPEPDCLELEKLKETLASDRVESSVSGIIIASLDLVTPERLEAVMSSLLEISRYFLEVGDFRALEELYGRVCDLGPDAGEAMVSLREKVTGFFGSQYFMVEVLNGLDLWGREKYRDIGSLIRIVGSPFINPLLDRLAEEENRVLRRWCLDQVVEMGDLAKGAVLERLGDRRWYVVRNLVTILQHTWQPDVPGTLAGLANFPHPKVRQAVLDALLRFHDVEGVRLILQDLDGNDAERRMQAIQLAAKSNDPRVQEALLRLLGKRGLSPGRFGEKKAAIHSLARRGNAAALPLLEKLLSSRSFLRPALMNQLKREAVLSLANYRHAAAAALLRKTANSSNRMLSELAAEVLETVEERHG